jgi:hypothetical protein
MVVMENTAQSEHFVGMPNSSVPAMFSSFSAVILRLYGILPVINVVVGQISVSARTG